MGKWLGIKYLTKDDFLDFFDLRQNQIPYSLYQLLGWITESEVDNLEFILERSEIGASWTTIAYYLTNDALNGRGNTSSRTEYSFTMNMWNPARITPTACPMSAPRAK
jgi:hypothetical protein